MVRPFRRGRIAPDPVDPTTWYTRTEVGRILGVSSVTIANYEKRKRLHPTIDARGVHRFDPAEVRTLLTHPIRNKRDHAPIRHPGELEACVYSMLSQGFNRREIVLRLMITSDDADKYYEKWKCETFEDAAMLARVKREAAMKLQEENERQKLARERREQFAETNRIMLKAALEDDDK